jgi:cytochrome c
VRHPPFGTVLVGFVLVGTAAAAVQGPAQSAWDGVYSEAQAARGRQAFLASCSGCHRDDLSGGDDNEPALTGDFFLAEWDGAPLAALFDFIATNMPKNRPGTLGLEKCIDIVGFILKSNGLPAGASDLKTDVKELERIRMTAKSPRQTR